MTNIKCTERSFRRYSEYRRGIRISGMHGTCHRPGERNKITTFSKASRKRLQWLEVQGVWSSMLTLTYHTSESYWNADLCIYEGPEIDCSGFKTVKAHINSWLQGLRRRGIDYLWAMEFQRRGVVHFHVLMNKRFDDVHLQDDNKGNSWRPLMESWLSITGQKNDKQARDFSLHQGMYTDWQVRGNGYLSKYMSKNEQKNLPEGVKFFGRWWGCSQGLKQEVKVTHVPDVVASEKKRAALDLGWKQFRRATKNFIERKFNYRFPRDKVKSKIGIRWIMTPKQVSCINRLSSYYLSELRST